MNDNKIIKLSNVCFNEPEKVQVFVKKTTFDMYSSIMLMCGTKLFVTRTQYWYISLLT